MYLLLQADQRLKQDHEDLPLLALLQELYLCVKEDGLILNQELDAISLSQWQKRLNSLLRHGQLPREEDGALEFWRLKIIFGGRAKCKEAEATRKGFLILY